MSTSPAGRELLQGILLTDYLIIRGGKAQFLKNSWSKDKLILQLWYHPKDTDFRGPAFHCSTAWPPNIYLWKGKCSLELEKLSAMFSCMGADSILDFAHYTVSVMITELSATIGNECEGWLCSQTVERRLLGSAYRWAWPRCVRQAPSGHSFCISFAVTTSQLQASALLSGHDWGEPSDIWYVFLTEKGKRRRTNVSHHQVLCCDKVPQAQPLVIPLLKCPPCLLPHGLGQAPLHPAHLSLMTQKCKTKSAQLEN